MVGGSRQKHSIDPRLSFGNLETERPLRERGQTLGFGEGTPSDHGFRSMSPAVDVIPCLVVKCCSCMLIGSGGYAVVGNHFAYDGLSVGVVYFQKDLARSVLEEVQVPDVYFNGERFAFFV